MWVSVADSLVCLQFYANYLSLNFAAPVPRLLKVEASSVTHLIHSSELNWPRVSPVAVAGEHKVAIRIAIGTYERAYARSGPMS